MRGELLWRLTSAHHIWENMGLFYVTIKQYYKEKLNHFQETIFFCFVFLQRNNRKLAKSLSRNRFLSKCCTACSECCAAFEEILKTSQSHKRANEMLCNCPEQSELLHLSNLVPPWAFTPHLLRCSCCQPGLSSSGSTLGVFSCWETEVYSS